MKLKERAIIANWRGLSAYEVENIQRLGLVDNIRFDERTRKTWLRVWYWSNFKFCDSGAWSQDKYWVRHGQVGLERRYARAQKLGKALGMM